MPANQRTAMLQLRPTCENCNAALPPNSIDAMICTFERTFCRSCVENVLDNVCPNCGGGFCSRPVRPKNDWNGGNFLGAYPASTAVKHRPLDPMLHKRFARPAMIIRSLGHRRSVIGQKSSSSASVPDMSSKADKRFRGSSRAQRMCQRPLRGQSLFPALPAWCR
jgi:hypothetical protein